MVNSVHFLLTYACNFQCDHCFLFSGPDAGGTFDVVSLRAALRDAAEVGTVDTVFFEGGEPLLYFPLLAEGIRVARKLGLKTGIVTNAYWATSKEDALVWLTALRAAGLDSLTMSDDGFHYGDSAGRRAPWALQAGKEAGLAVDVICKERPEVHDGAGDHPEISGGVKFRGRAVQMLTAGLPTRSWDELTRCPHEPLKDPQRVHADCFGNLHLCQGLSMGNYRERSMRSVMRDYDPARHPIVGPLLAGGPAELVRRSSVPHAPRYVDECHLCYETRLALRDRYPALLAPPQVYGLSSH